METLQEKEVIKVEITKHEVWLDPILEVYQVVLSTKTGLWPVSIGSKHDLKLFLEGLRVCHAMQQHTTSAFDSPIPAIPEHVTSVFTESNGKEDKSE